jgi:hypothetical protein
MKQFLAAAPAAPLGTWALALLDWVGLAYVGLLIVLGWHTWKHGRLKRAMLVVLASQLVRWWAPGIIGVHGAGASLMGWFLADLVLLVEVGVRRWSLRPITQRFDRVVELCDRRWRSRWYTPDGVLPPSGRHLRG